MKTYLTGESAPYGVYAAVRPLDLRFVGADGERVEGIVGARYVRVPTLLVLAGGPVLGAIFVMAFPILVFAAAGTALGMAVARRVRPLVERHAYLAEARWEPAASYLDKPCKSDKKDAEGDATGGVHG